MNRSISQYSVLIFCLLYSIIVTVWNIDYNSVYHDEALNIVMGNQVLGQEACPGCPQNTGSVLVQPILAALGDRIGGLEGARGVGIIFGLGLTTSVFFLTRRMFTAEHANTAAILTVISSTHIYLSMLATYDIVSACFLALSFWLLIESKTLNSGKALLFLSLSSLLLFMAAITKYAVSVFILSFYLYFALSYRNIRRIAIFSFILATLSAIYFFFALMPMIGSLGESVSGVYSESHIPIKVIINWALRWLSIPGVFLAFAAAKSPYRREVIILAFMSIPLILLHLATGAAQSINKNIIFSFVFMMPATAIGLHCMSAVFSGDTGKTLNRYFFAGMLIIVLWVFGIQDLRWLKHQYPDMSPVIRHIYNYGHNNMQLVIDSDFGNATYAYSLQGKFKGAVYESIREYEARRIISKGTIPLPDYIVLDDYHKKKALRDKALEYIGTGRYSLEKTFTIKMSWGDMNVRLYRRIS